MASLVTVPLPPKVWMHKPRSQKNDGGFFSKFRGAGSWQRRCVSVENHAICYGENVDAKLKVIPLETVTSVERVPRDKCVKDEAPPHFADFGWSFAYDAKVVVFVCEDLETRERWVTYLEAFLEAMRNMAPSTAAVSDTPGTGATLAAMATAAPGEVAAVPGAAPIPTSVVVDDDDEGGGGSGGTGHQHTQDQLKRLMGCGDDDDEAKLDSLDWNEDDNDDDDDDSDEDDDENAADSSARAVMNAPRLLVERQLRQLAQQPYNHIAFKMDKYAPHFVEGDTPKDVLFSRSVFKISKKNNNNERDLVLTHSRLYLFAVGGLISSVSVKQISINQIVGVVESTESASLFALLIPSWHDVLLRIAPQNSVLGGTEAEVKTQLIAHLFVACSKIAPGRQFLFREAANVPSIIRRSEDDQHQPLRSEEGDRFRVASNAELYSTFRVNAESVVYLSCHVQRVNAELKYSPRIFIVTDGGVYLAHADGSRISRRASLNDISLMKCDNEMPGVLLALPEMDWVVFPQSQPDYQAIVRWVPEAAQRGCRHTVRVTPSRNLLHNARLMEAKNLMDRFMKAGSTTEDGLKAALKFTQKVAKQSWKMSKQSVGWISKNVENVATESLDIMKQGAVGIGGMLLDNAITGELRGLTESMLSVAGAVQARIVMERIIRLADVEKNCELREPTTDSLKMAGTQPLSTFAQSHKEIDTSIVFFSARCKHFALAATLDTTRSSDMFAVLTGSGIVLFDDPSGSSTSMVTGSKTLLTRAFKSLIGEQVGLVLNEFIPWNDTRGVVRCISEPNLVGILNNTSAVSTLRDVMIRFANTKLADAFTAHFLNLYAGRMTPAEGRGFWKVLPGCYTAATGEHLRAALKSSAFELEPTIGLRTHVLGGDELRIAVDNVVVDQIRRFGDNSVRYSSLAWRLKTSTVRKDPTQALKAATEQTTEAGSHGAGLDRKLYKQCGLVVTNCAVYQFEEGSKTINRRLPLLYITSVKRCNADPDAILLVVPREYDFFIRVEGRAQEFIDKVLEARNEWSDASVELPTDIDEESFLPIFDAEQNEKYQQAQLKKQHHQHQYQHQQHQQQQGGSIAPIELDLMSDPVFTVGRLVKPKSFSEEQSHIQSSEVSAEYTAILMREIRKALDEAMDDPSSPTGVLGGTTSSILHFERSMARVRFAAERAYTFGLRPQQRECHHLALALTLLEFHRRWREILLRLQRASQHDYLTDFQAAEADARALNTSIEQRFMLDKSHECAVSNSFLYAISTALELQKPQLEAMKSRAVIKSDIERLIQRAATAGPEGVIADLEESVISADELGVHPSLLERFRVSFDTAVQTYRMSKVAAYAWSPPLCDVFEEAKFVITSTTSNAAGGVGASPSGSTVSFASGSTTEPPAAVEKKEKRAPGDVSVWAQRSLEAAVNSGDLSQMEFEIKAVKGACAADGKEGTKTTTTMPPAIAAAVERASELADELRRRQPVLDDLRRCGDDFRRRAAGLTCEQLVNFEKEFAHILEQLPRHVASLRAARDTAYVLFSTIQLQRKAAEQQEEAALEERALAAAYSKSANDDAIASAQRYERAQQAKLEAQMRERRTEIEELAQRASRLLFDTKRAVASEEADRITALGNSIEPLTAQLQVMLGKCTADAEVRALDEVVNAFHQYLTEAAALVQSFNEQHAARRGTAIPPDAIAAAQKLDQASLVAYLESGELDIASLKALGEMWQKAADHKRQLHRLRQRAFVVDSTDEDSVNALLNDAGSIGVENDVVIAKVRDSFEKSKQQAAAKKLKKDTSSSRDARSNAKAQSQPSQGGDGSTSNAEAEEPAAKPKFVPPATYDTNYYWVSCKGGGIFLDVHGALTQLLKKPGAVDSKKESGRYELPKDIFATDIKDFCGRLENFFMHRVKPSGFFRKTPRSLFDLVTELGKLTRGGDVVAPFCAHLVGEFERVKKLNNANGLTSDQVLVRLLLQKRDLQRIFDDLARLNAKERENLFFEDSVWILSDDVASKDLTLFAKMCAQIVWPFNFTDRRHALEASPTSSSSSKLSTDALAGVPSLATFGQNTPDGMSFAETTSVAPSQAPVAGAGGPTVEVAVGALRHAVRMFGSFFQSEMRALGAAESTVEQKRRIFDETRTKMCGVIVREELCPAIAMLFRTGIKPATSILSRFQKREPWDVVVGATERVRQSAHGLSGIALPEAVDTVLGLTDPAMASSRRGQSAVSKMNAQQLSDVRFRMFLCYALNRKLLTSLVLNAIFDPHANEFLGKFYLLDKSVFQDEEARAEVQKIFEYLEKLPFILSLDAEIW